MRTTDGRRVHPAGGMGGSSRPQSALCVAMLLAQVGTVLYMRSVMARCDELSATNAALLAAAAGPAAAGPAAAAAAAGQEPPEAELSDDGGGADGDSDGLDVALAKAAFDRAATLEALRGDDDELDGWAAGGGAAAEQAAAASPPAGGGRRAVAAAGGGVLLPLGRNLTHPSGRYRRPLLVRFWNYNLTSPVRHCLSSTFHCIFATFP